MPLDNPRPGGRYAPDLNTAGIPWVTSSNLNVGQTMQIQFRFVPNYLFVRNTSTSAAAQIAVGFTLNGTQTGGNFYLLKQGDTINAPVMYTQIFLSASVGTPSFSLLAPTSMIDTRDWAPALTGSKGWEGIG